jgi:hypothetical protein
MLQAYVQHPTSNIIVNEDKIAPVFTSLTLITQPSLLEWGPVGEQETGAIIIPLIHR